MVPLLAAHGDDAQVGVGRASAGIGGEDGAETFFSGVEIVAAESVFALGEEGLGI